MNTIERPASYLLSNLAERWPLNDGYRELLAQFIALHIVRSRPGGRCTRTPPTAAANRPTLREPHSQVTRFEFRTHAAESRGAAGRR
jgi:hypothetical protein